MWTVTDKSGFNILEVSVVEKLQFAHNLLEIKEN